MLFMMIITRTTTYNNDNDDNYDVHNLLSVSLALCLYCLCLFSSLGGL